MVSLTRLHWEVLFIVIWDVAALFLVDFAKMIYKCVFMHMADGIIDEAALAAEDAQSTGAAPIVDAQSSTPMLSHISSHHRHTLSARGGSIASFTDFMATGRVPFRGQFSASHSSSPPSYESAINRASLHPRTPAMIAQQRSFFQSCHL